MARSARFSCWASFNASTVLACFNATTSSGESVGWSGAPPARATSATAKTFAVYIIALRKEKGHGHSERLMWEGAARVQAAPVPRARRVGSQRRASKGKAE